MATYKNNGFTKRNYDCTNIVACVTDENPNERGDWKQLDWQIATDGILNGLTKLYICNGVAYYGYL
jgi:hypothetical protein